MTLKASHIKKNKKNQALESFFPMIFENISIIFAHDINFDKRSESLNL